VKYRMILLIGVGILFSCGGQDISTDADIVTPVSVQEIKQKSIEEFITTTGTVLPSQEALLQSEISGYYQLLKNPKTGRAFALGDVVEKGREIIHLKDDEFENNIKLESQKLNLDISKSEYEKQQSLYKKGGVTLRELRNAELDLVNAQYSFENAEIQLAKMKIIAPFSGTIVELPYYTEGTKVSSNLSMVKLMNYGALYMEANLPAKELDHVKVNLNARVMNYALPDDTLKGRITQVSPAIDATSRTFKASLLIDNPNLALRPGMFVKTDIIVALKDSALVIPKEIILSKQRGKTVFVVQRGMARERVVSTGLENANEVEVIRGLGMGERVVMKGFETLQNQSKVKVLQ